jgi:glycosyltransferase involved in cell wall biosynthesis
MPKLLYLVTEDWFFCSHFLPMARAAKRAGYEVAVATRVKDHGPAIASEGIRLLPLATERRSFSPFKTARAFLAMLETVRAEKPDIVHCIALPMVVLGGAAARFSRVPAVVLAPTGLGHLWIEKGNKARLARAAVRLAVKGLKGRNVHFLFENADDPREFGIDPGNPARVTLVGGAGVDEAAFAPSPEPAAPVLKVALVARMIASKGIFEAVSAVRQARERGARIELSLFGAPDAENRGSISERDLRELSDTPGVAWHGTTSDVGHVWREHHVAILLSRREGAPRSLIEAAACGRPIVASDVTGCREIVAHGENGFLVDPSNAEAVAEALIALAERPLLRVRFGERSRQRFEERFTEGAVTEGVLSLYRRCAAERAAARPLAADEALGGLTRPRSAVRGLPSSRAPNAVE